MKAYDCMENNFIWADMKALGFDDHIIILARGLVENATSKVYINGRFMESIELERG